MAFAGRDSPCIVIQKGMFANGGMPEGGME
jgi:hypothetical protein